MFAKIENGKITEWPIPSIAALFPNTSFPDVLNENSIPDGYVVVAEALAPITKSGQRAVPARPVKRGDKWVQSWDVVDISQEEINEQARVLAASVRAERDRRITESDWVILKAYERQTAPSKEWIDYRQALREITNQSDFPQNVNWPVAPK